eukprot:gene38064-44387_t
MLQVKLGDCVLGGIDLRSQLALASRDVCHQTLVDGACGTTGSRIAETSRDTCDETPSGPVMPRCFGGSIRVHNTATYQISFWPQLERIRAEMLTWALRKV